MGDEKFFRKLNEAAKGNSGDGAGWGNISATWTPTSYNEALEALPSSEEMPQPGAGPCGNPFPGDAQN